MVASARGAAARSPSVGSVGSVGAPVKQNGTDGIKVKQESAPQSNRSEEPSSDMQFKCSVKMEMDTGDDATEQAAQETNADEKLNLAPVVASAQQSPAGGAPTPGSDVVKVETTTVAESVPHPKLAPNKKGAAYIYSFTLNIYIAPLKENYSVYEALEISQFH